MSGPRSRYVTLALAAVVACTDRPQVGAHEEAQGNDSTLDAGDQESGGSEDTGRSENCPPVRPDAAAISEAEMASSMAAILCIAQVECDCPVRSHQGVPSCRHSANMVFERMRTAAQARGLTYDGLCLGQLEAAVEALGCDVVDPDGAFAEVLGAGRCGVYHGERGVGESCVSLSNVASDCAQGLACWGGVCAQPCGAKHGTRSNPYGYACPDAERMTHDGRCERPAAIGETCGPIGCVPGAYCPRCCITECRPVPAAGEPCEGDPACPGGFCEAGMCVAAPGEGEPCSSNGCGPGLHCELGVCTPVPSICALPF